VYDESVFSKVLTTVKMLCLDLRKLLSSSFVLLENVLGQIEIVASQLPDKTSKYGGCVVGVSITLPEEEG